MTDLFNNQTINDSPVDIECPSFGREDDPDASSMMRQKQERYMQDTSHRHSLIGWMMVVVSIWLILVICIVALNVKCQLFISDTVLNTLLATTTVNILGLPFIILKDLFNGR